MKKIKVLIIGGGINGLAIARSLSASYNANVTLVEKEDSLGFHASSRNSGVIHAGIYYEPDGSKGKLCSTANQIFREYCVKNNIPLNKCGKVIVARNIEENHKLELLYERAIANRAKVKLLGQEALNSIEPNARTFSRFIWSPNTWSASPHIILQTLKKECDEVGVNFLLNSVIKELSADSAILACKRVLRFDFLVNAAGANSLQIYNKISSSRRYSLLPFRGMYLKSKSMNNNFKAHIYPVPQDGEPFLGIHTTLTHDGYLKLGPTAFPCLSGENYRYLSGLDYRSLGIAADFVKAFVTNASGLRRLAIREINYLMKSSLVAEASTLTQAPFKPDDYNWYTPGIRSQLFDTYDNKLVKDFKSITHGNTIHLLNSVSPSWTCAFLTARLICQEIDHLTN